MLWLIFKDEDGAENRVEVDRDVFTVGRHSECDLTYTDSRLSREHVRIERKDGDFAASDLGSSNGTTINDGKLNGPTTLKDGDVLDLGGGFQLTVESEPDAETGPAAAGADVNADTPDINSAEAAGPNLATPAPSFAPAAASAGGGGIPLSFFVIAPLLGIFVLAIVIGGILLFGGGEKEVANNYADSEYSTGDEEEDDKSPDADEGNNVTPVKSATPSVNLPSSNSGTTPPTSGGTESVPAGDKSETAKIEQNSTTFVRQIAQNDPRAFLTGEQAAKVNAKVKQIGRSSALADNINSARKNAAAIKSLAASKNLKPQFLAVAAIVKLGGGRGDALQAAQSVADVYDKLSIQVGGENFDEALLLVAAYDQGAAGDTMKLRNMMQQIAEQPGSPGSREIRSIWFLQKTGKITQGEYDRALSFLAIGTIAQNPKDFGVNAEALRL